MSASANLHDRPDWDRLRQGALVAGAAGLAVCLLGAVFGVQHFFRSYLVGFTFWLGVALGCLVILMLQYLTGGRWGLALRGVLESGTRTLLPLAVLFLPVLAGLPWLYAWARPDEVARHPNIVRTIPHLNVAFFSFPFVLLRAAVYFGAWLSLALVLNRWSAGRGPDQADEPRKLRLLSSGGLVVYGLTVTFASIDWVMSLQPDWYSTIFPPLVAGGQVLSGLAFAVAVLLLLATRPPLAGRLGPGVLRDLGNLLLAFVMVWAYLSFSQFLIIWSGNLPEETSWYVRRIQGGWQWLPILLAVLHFALPFLLLLSRDVKEDPRRLAAAAGLILVTGFLDVLWWIEPSFAGGLSAQVLLDVAALVGVGGLWGWWFLGQLARRPVLPPGALLAEGSNHD